MFEFADRIILLENGEIGFNGAPRKMAEEMVFKDLPVIGPQHVELSQELVKAGFPREVIEPSLKKSIQKLDELTETISPIKDTRKAISSTRVITPEPMVQFDHVTFSYPYGFTALKDINLEFHEGDFVLLSGWNGSGKTTLAKHLNASFGLLKAGCSSEVRIFLPDRRLIWRGRLGFSFRTLTTNFIDRR